MKTTLLIVCFLFSVVLFAQRTDTYSYHIVYDNNNGFYKSNIIDTNSSGNWDICISKYDSNSALQWSKIYGGSASDFVTQVAFFNNHFYTVGYTSSNSFGLRDILLCSSDTLGNTKYFTFGTPDNDEGVILFNSNDNLTLLGTTEPSLGKNDIVLIEIDSSFLVKSSVYLNIEGKEKAGAYFYDSLRKNHYIGGKSDLLLGNEDDMLVVKLDSLKNAVWAKLFFATDKQEISDIAQDSAGNIYLAGYSRNSWYNGVIIKLDTAGNIIWQKRYESAVANKFFRIRFLHNELYLGGVLSSITGSYDNFFVTKIDTSGAILWSKELIYPQDEYMLHFTQRDSFFVCSGPVKEPTKWSYLVEEIDSDGNSCASMNVNLSELVSTLSDTALSVSALPFVYQTTLDSVLSDYAEPNFSMRTCIAYKGTEPIDTIGIVEENLLTGYNISQNADILTISGNHSSFEVMLFDVFGRLLDYKKTTESSIDLKLPAVPIYILRVLSKSESLNKKMFNTTY